MNHKFKLKQRISALCMAAMMCCGMFPSGALAESDTGLQTVSTPETATQAVDAEQNQPIVTESAEYNEDVPIPESTADTAD